MTTIGKLTFTAEEGRKLVALLTDNGYTARTASEKGYQPVGTWTLEHRALCNGKHQFVMHISSKNGVNGHPTTKYHTIIRLTGAPLDKMFNL